MPNAETIPPDYILYVAWLKAQIDNKTIVGQPVTADSNKVILTGNPNEAALKPFGIDIDPSKIEINDLDGVLDIIKGGTGLSTIGTAGQLIRVDSLGTALEYFTANYGTVSSVALTMPSAFSVSGSPVTTSGTLAVTGAGTTGQYIRGDGTLANFPTSIGGGASINYYLNGSINQGVFGGNTYYQMSRNAIIGSAANFNINTNGYIAQFITDVNDPSQLNIPSGNWVFEMYFSSSSSGGSPNFYVELYKYDGVNFTLIASSSTSPEIINNGTSLDLYTTTLAVPTTNLALTDRLAMRVYVNNAGRTITLHTQDNTLCQVITTFTTGITAINGLTAQVQTFATGTSGTDFNIVSSGSTHTFNLPTASATNKGALSSADWSTFNGKQNAITLTTSGSSGASTFISDTLNIPNYTADGILPSQTGNSGKYLNTNGSTASWQSIPTYIRLNDNNTVTKYDYCGTALTGTAQSSPTWLIRRIDWSAITPVTLQATGAWSNRTSLIYT